MTQRLPLALGICAGYVLGRTRKAKFALTVAGMAAGKKLPLSPQALGSLLADQLNKNPQLKEVRDQLRTELGGVGKAATGALVERQIGGIADRLEGRTQGLQNRLKGVGRDEPDDEAARDDVYDDEFDERDERDEQEPEDRNDAEEEPRKRPARAKRAPAKKTAAKKKAAKTAGKKAAPAKKTASGTRRAASGAKKTAGSRKPSGSGGGGRRG